MKRVAEVPTLGIAFDTETHLIQPGIFAPPLVCASVANHEGARLLDRDSVLDVFRYLLANHVIIGANIAFDMIVMATHAAKKGIDIMPEIFEAYRDDRVFDVLIAEALYGISNGTLGYRPDGSPLISDKGKQTRYYSLSSVVSIRLGRENAKDRDEYRLRYAELENIPVAEWPPVAQQYPIDDAVNTYEACLAQLEDPNIHDVGFQSFAAFALNLGAAWGLRTDSVYTEKLAAEVEAFKEAGNKKFIDLGFLRDDGGCDTGKVKEYLLKAYGCYAPCYLCNGTGRKYDMISCIKKCPGDATCKKCMGTLFRRKPGPGKKCSECDGTGIQVSDKVPKTKTGNICKDRDTLTECGDDTLAEFADFGKLDKVLSTYIPWFRQGYDKPLTLRPNSLLNTGRVSYEGVIQLIPRGFGVRECVVPRTGNVFYACDYSGLELVTHAQSCLWICGESKLAEAINAGMDVHSYFASQVVGISYDDFISKKHEPKLKAMRQTMKALNFGLPGGMGAVKLVMQQRAQGPDTTSPNGKKYRGLRFCITVGGEETCGKDVVTEWKGREVPPTCLRCIGCAEDLKEQWFMTWPENQKYFRHIGNQVDTKGYIVQHVSKRVRGGVHFTAAAKTYFQGLAGDGAKLAQIKVSTEQYNKGTILYGTRSIAFIHDELLGETPEAIASPVVLRVQELMIEAMRRYTPDVTVRCEPVLMRRWSKAAETVYNDAGEVLVWEP